MTQSKNAHHLAASRRVSVWPAAPLSQALLPVSFMMPGVWFLFFLSTSQLTWGSCGVWAQLQHSRQGEGCLFPEVRLQASRIQNWAHTTTETRGGKMVASHFLGATDGHLLITCSHMKESFCFTATVIWMHKPTRKQSLSSTCVNLISFTVAG